MDYDSADEVGDRKPYFPNQKDVNDLIRDLGLTKSNAELLISRLKQWNLVDDSVQATDQRKRHQRFSNLTLRRIIAQRTGHNGPSFLLGRAM